MAFPGHLTMAQSSQSRHPQNYTSDQFSHPRAQDLPLDLTAMGQFYPLPTQYLPQDCGIMRQPNPSGNQYHPLPSTPTGQLSLPRGQYNPLPINATGQVNRMWNRCLPMGSTATGQFNKAGNQRIFKNSLTQKHSGNQFLSHTSDTKGKLNEERNGCQPATNSVIPQFNQSINRYAIQHCTTLVQSGNQRLPLAYTSMGQFNQPRAHCPPSNNTTIGQFNHPRVQCLSSNNTTMGQLNQPRAQCLSSNNSTMDQLNQPRAQCLSSNNTTMGQLNQPRAQCLSSNNTTMDQLNQPRAQCLSSNNTTMDQLNQPRAQCLSSNNTTISQFNQPRAQCLSSNNTTIGQFNQPRAKCLPSHNTTMGQFSQPSNQYIPMDCTPTDQLSRTVNPYIPQSRTKKRTFHQMSQVPHLGPHTYQPITPSGIPIIAHASPVQPKRHNATHLPLVYSQMEQISQSQSPHFSTADSPIRHDDQRVSPDPHLPESSVEQVMGTNFSVTPLVIQPQYETSQIASSTSGQLNSATTLATGIVMYSDEQSNLPSATRRQSDLGDSRDPHLPKASLEQVKQTNISVTPLIIQPQYETSQIESSTSGQLNSATTLATATGVYSDEKFPRATDEVKMDDRISYLSRVVINVDKSDPAKHHDQFDASKHSYYACSSCGSLFLTESKLCTHDCIGTIVKNENQTDEQLSKIVPAVMIQPSAKETICVDSQDLSRCIKTESEDCNTSSFMHAQEDLISHAAKCTNNFLNCDSQPTCAIDRDSDGIEQDKTRSEEKKSDNIKLKSNYETLPSAVLKSVESKHTPLPSFVQANYLIENRPIPLLSSSKTNLTGEQVLHEHDDIEDVSKCLRDDGKFFLQSIDSLEWNARPSLSNPLDSDFLAQGSGDSPQSIMNKRHGKTENIYKNLQSPGRGTTLANQSHYQSIDQTTIVPGGILPALGSSQLLSESNTPLEIIPNSLRLNSCNDSSSQRVAGEKKSNADGHNKSIISIPITSVQTLSGIGAAQPQKAANKVTDGVANFLVQNSYSSVPVQSCAGENANSLVLNSGNCGNEGHTLSAIGATQPQNAGRKAYEGMATTLLLNNDACGTVESIGWPTPLNTSTTINTHTLPSDLSYKPSQMMGCKACHMLFSSTSKFESHDCEASVLWLSDEGSFNGSIPENPRCFHDKKKSSINWMWKTPDYPVNKSQTDVWKCKYCDMVCQSRIQLVFHFQYVHSKIVSFCPYCMTCLATKIKMLSHMCQRHSGCRSCPELQFETLDDVTAHCNSDKHRMKRPFLCHRCGKGLSTPKSLRIHMREHNNDSFSCPICPMKFGYSEQMERHTRQAHAKCMDCDLRFGNVQSLIIHRREVQHRIQWAFKCDDCDNTFSSIYDRNLHCSKVHKKEKKFSCRECDSSFLGRNGLDIHCIRKHGHKPLASCSICGKGFANKDQLELHMSSHSEARPFQCDICGKSFKLSQHLTQHRVTHATDNDEDRPYKCHLCDKGFKLPHHLRQHASTHETAESRSGNDKLCDKCGQYYKRDHKKCSKRPQKKQHEKQLSSGDHGTVSPTQSCFLCTHQVADSDEMLSKHLKNYHLVAESCTDVGLRKTRVFQPGKPISCTKCDVKFNSRIPFKAHLRQCQVLKDGTKKDDYLSISENVDIIQPTLLPSETQMDGADTVSGGDCMNTFLRGDCHCPLCKKVTGSVHHLKVHLIQQHWMTESDVIDVVQGNIVINNYLL